MSVPLSTPVGEPALFRHAPGLRTRIEWLPIGRYPTPLERIELPGYGPILVKRDDAYADGYAGNKVRKLEFLLPHARSRGASRLITAGAAGSHHALATAYHGRNAGFDVSLVLFPQPLTDRVRDVLLMDRAVGAELRWVPRMEAVPYGVLRARLSHQAERPCVIPPGGSDEIGTLGYVSGALELADQLRERGQPAPSRVHVAGGTLGTAAGIAIGLAWARLDVRVVVTRITSRIVTNTRVLQRLVRRTLALLRSAGAAPPRPGDVLRLVELRHDQIGPGYCRTTADADHAAQLFASLGIALDVGYTAKTAAGLLSCERSIVPPLYWHTLSAVEPRSLLRDVQTSDLPEPFAQYVQNGG